MNNIQGWILPILFGGALLFAVPYLVSPLIKRSGLMRANFKGDIIPTAFGLIPLIICVGLILLDILFVGPRLYGTYFHSLNAFLFIVIIFGWLGFVDDLYGSHDARGLKGHLKAFFNGQVTSGLIKAIGGLIAGFLSAYFILNEPIVHSLISGLLIALTANFINLLDLRPGRAMVPFCILAPLVFLVTMKSYGYETHAILYVWLGALRILLMDVRGKAMLGDTGSNLLGAALGLAIVLSSGIYVQLGLVIVLLLVHILTEKYSISSMIERYSVLHAIDRMLGVR
ncbi:MAG: hypothetical protein WCO51_13400 [bacterium]|jgi:UDP-GlcNAc:undecaprenyl-phosphate GlcNAc-1-phosphate transferase